MYINKFPLALVKPLMCRLHMTALNKLFRQTSKQVQPFKLPTCKPRSQKYMKDVPSAMLSNPNQIAQHRPEFQVSAQAKLYKQTTLACTGSLLM